MANTSDFKNLSPFADSKKSSGGDSGSKGLLILGVLGLLALAALVFVTLTLTAGS